MSGARPDRRASRRRAAATGIRCGASLRTPGRRVVRRASARSRPSSVTRRTARQLLNLVLGDETLAELRLIGRRNVVDTEDGVARTHDAVFRVDYVPPADQPDRKST